MPAMLPELHDVQYDRAADAHDDDSQRNDHAAWRFAREGDPEMAVLTRRNAMLDRELADVDRDMARLERRRAA
jgi:hypothetical protein